MNTKNYLFAGLILVPVFLSAQSDTSATKMDSLVPAPIEVEKIPAPGNLKVYKLKPAVDIPLTAVTAGWSLYAFTKIYSKPHSTDEQILALDKNDVNGFDRGAIRPFSESLDRVSYYPFFGVMPMPFLFLTGKKTRKDFFKITYLYLETMSITGFLYTGSVYFTNRYRPYAYSSESTWGQRIRGGAKNSFYAGHVALVATSSFFWSQSVCRLSSQFKNKVAVLYTRRSNNCDYGILTVQSWSTFPIRYFTWNNTGRGDRHTGTAFS